MSIYYREGPKPLTFFFGFVCVCVCGGGGCMVCVGGGGVCAVLVDDDVVRFWRLLLYCRQQYDPAWAR